MRPSTEPSKNGWYFVYMPMEANWAPQSSQYGVSEWWAGPEEGTPVLGLAWGALPIQQNKSKRKRDQSSSESRETVLITVPF